MKKLILLCLLSFLATTWAKVPIPSVDTSLGILDFNIPLISIPGKGIENLDFTMYYKKPHPFSFRKVPESPIKNPLGKSFEHNLNIVLHYAPYELKEIRKYKKVIGPFPLPSPPPPPSEFDFPYLSDILPDGFFDFFKEKR